MITEVTIIEIRLGSLPPGTWFRRGGELYICGETSNGETLITKVSDGSHVTASPGLSIEPVIAKLVLHRHMPATAIPASLENHEEAV